MINFKILDKNKTYVCLEYGTGTISKLIQQYTKEYCDNVTPPSHVFALVYDNRVKDWLVFESHSNPSEMGCLSSGTRRYYRVILEKVFPQVLTHTEVYQLDINVDTLYKFLCKPYGFGDILQLMKAALHHTNGKQKDRPGYICSEYIALSYPLIQEYFDLPSWCITPAHFKKYVMDNQIGKIS